MNSLRRIKTEFTKILALSTFKSQKIFCIGRNKTGTTSMARLLSDLGYLIAHQKTAERHFENWLNNDFDPIIRFTKYGGHAFQDVPYSLPGTYKVLDQNFPNSKFILTIRDSPEVWYESLVRFHSKVFGNGKIPSKEDLKKATYVQPGWIWEVNQAVYGAPEDDPYNRTILIKSYVEYNREVIDYFKDQSDKLLVINLKDKHVAELICQFVGSKKNVKEMPWENKT